MASIKVKWRVNELTNVMLVYDQVKVYRSTTGETGVYSEITTALTRVDLVAGTTLYEFIDTAGDETYWYKTAYFNSSTSAESSASDPIQGQYNEFYTSLQDIRDEGITSAMYDDARVVATIELAARYVEVVTGHWFVPRTRTFKVKARNTGVVFLSHPIISVSAINIVSGRGSNIDRDEVSVDDVLVFNRHLTEGLLDPDDRLTPRLEFENLLGLEYPGREDAVWAYGSQVVEVTGRFGYTELLPGETPGETSDGSQVPVLEGSTPLLISHVCKLLVMRDLALMSDTSTRDDWRNRWRLEQEKTIDQMYKLTPLSTLSLSGRFTGDPEIDGILSQYMATPSIGVV